MAEKIIIHKPGSYKELKIASFNIEDPQPNEVQICIYASGVNYADVCVRWGIYESAKKYIGWPITPGFEFSGVVIKTGINAKNFNVGDEVFGVKRFGAYASHLNVTEKQIFIKPKYLSHEKAASIPAVFLTAYHALFQNVIIRPNSKILIHSAAGGVGSSLVQMSKCAGHEVIGIVGCKEKIDYLKNLGVDLSISTETENWIETVKHKYPEGVDIILDANGYKTLKDSFELLAPMGKLICYGFHSMLPKKGGKLNLFQLIYGYVKTPRFNPMNMTTKNKSLITFNLSFLFDKNELFQEAMTQIIEWLDQKIIKAPKTSSYNYKNVAKAHQDIESGKTEGKLILLFK